MRRRRSFPTDRSSSSATGDDPSCSILRRWEQRRRCRVREATSPEPCPRIERTRRGQRLRTHGPRSCPMVGYCWWAPRPAMGRHSTPPRSTTRAPGIGLRHPGALHEARAYHTAAPPPDGRVLVAGGRVLVTQPEKIRIQHVSPHRQRGGVRPNHRCILSGWADDVCASGSSMCCGQVDHFPAMVLPMDVCCSPGVPYAQARALTCSISRTNTFIGVPTFRQGDIVVLPMAGAAGVRTGLRLRSLKRTGRAAQGLRRTAAARGTHGPLTAGCSLLTAWQHARAVPPGQRRPGRPAALVGGVNCILQRSLRPRFDGRPSVQTPRPAARWPDRRLRAPRG